MPLSARRDTTVLLVLAISLALLRLAPHFRAAKRKPSKVQVPVSCAAPPPKSTTTFYLSTAQIGWLASSKRLHNLPDLGKTARCVIQYAMSLGDKLVLVKGEAHGVEEIELPLRDSQIAWLRQEQQRVSAPDLSSCLRWIVEGVRVKRDDNLVFTVRRCGLPRQRDALRTGH